MRQESAIDYLPSLNAGRSGARPGHDSWVLFTVDTDTDWLSGDHGPWDMDTQKLKKKKRKSTNSKPKSLCRPSTGVTTGFLGVGTNL